MVRLFRTNYLRNTAEIGGVWDFVVDGGGEYKLPVPGCWEMHPDLGTYRGSGRFTKSIYVERDCNLRLVFKGVSHTARVAFDGAAVAQHYGAYTPFDAVITGVCAGWHTICVDVDNSFGEHSALHMPNDYYTYGGIVRPVVCEYLGDAYIERIEFVPKKTPGGWQADLRVFVRNISGGDMDLAICGEIAGNRLDFAGQNIAGNGVFSGIFDIQNIDEWDISNPNIYLLNVQLLQNGTAIDDLIERVGFREVLVDGEKILLNGREIFIKGFNRHEDHPIFGMSLNLQAMATDIALIKDMNANCVRTSHYPNDELFLDLCDEHGILVWEENHARGLSEEKMRNPNFDRQCEECIDEMVKNHFNHPSIIIWGVLNECASNTEYGRDCYARQIAQIKALDKSRPVTYATHFKYRDISLDLADIISWNIYFGWYENIPAMENVTKLLEYSDANGGGAKPVIISEFGGGAIPGYRDRRRVKWSEERQCDILEETLAAYLHHPRITGAIIWQFCDCLVTEEEWYDRRPRTKNNKGVVDQFRQPKLAYDVVKQHFGIGSTMELGRFFDEYIRKG